MAISVIAQFCVSPIKDTKTKTSTPHFLHKAALIGDSCVLIALLALGIFASQLGFSIPVQYILIGAGSGAVGAIFLLFLISMKTKVCPNFALINPNKKRPQKSEPTPLTPPPSAITTQTN